MNVDKCCVVHSLKFISTLTSGIFAGGALYINLVESPARSTHDAETAVTIWKPSFIRARFCMSKLTFISGLSSIGAYYLAGNKCPMKWLLAGSMMLTIAPYTIFFMVPTNEELLETEKCIEKGTPHIEEKLQLWDKRHAVRTAISFGAFGYMLYLLSKGK